LPGWFVAARWVRPPRETSVLMSSDNEQKNADGFGYKRCAARGHLVVDSGKMASEWETDFKQFLPRKTRKHCENS
jgi:hypothetical protein